MKTWPGPRNAKHSKRNIFLFSAFSFSNSPPFKGVISNWFYFRVLFSCERISVFLNRLKFSIEITFKGSYQLLFVLAVLIQAALYSSPDNNRTKGAEKFEVDMKNS